MYALDDYWPMDKGNKWVYVSYTKLPGGELEKFGQSFEVIGKDKDENGRKYWTVSSKLLDANGSVTFMVTHTFFNENEFRYYSIPPIIDDARVLPRKIRVRDREVKTYCLAETQDGCAGTIYTNFARLKRLLSPEWLSERESEFGFNLANVYGHEDLLGTLVYNDSGDPLSGEPHYILKQGIGPVVIGIQFLQYARIDGIAHTYFPY